MNKMKMYEPNNDKNYITPLPEEHYIAEIKDKEAIERIRKMFKEVVSELEKKYENE